MVKKAYDTGLFGISYCALCQFSFSICGQCIITNKGYGQEQCYNTHYSKIMEIIRYIRINKFDGKKRKQLLKALNEELKFLESLKKDK